MLLNSDNDVPSLDVIRAHGMLKRTIEAYFDKVWVAHGLLCAVVHSPTAFYGPYNGYIRVPHGHPLYGLSADCLTRYVNVHGGVTYAHTDNERSIYGWDDQHFGIPCTHSAFVETDNFALQIYTLAQRFPYGTGRWPLT